MTDAQVSEARVVVGIDGSSDARRALGVALEEAVLRGAQLDIVHVWSVPYSPALPGRPLIRVDDSAQEAAHQKLLDDAVDAVRRGRPEDVQVEGILVNDRSAARTLVDTAKGADLLVVGARGLGGFSGLMLGSVSQQVVSHAPCPVLVIPPVDD